MSLINGKDEGIKNSANIVTRGLTIKGFTMGSYFHLAPGFGAAMQGWLGEVKIVFDATITDGIDNALDAFTGMMNGANTGKSIFRL
jgi:NADPH-dependent curcumin reductase CurA